MPRIRTLTVDATGTLRPSVFAALVVVEVAAALGLASLGGRVALAGIGVVQAATAAALVWVAGRG